MISKKLLIVFSVGAIVGSVFASLASYFATEMVEQTVVELENIATWEDASPVLVHDNRHWHDRYIEDHCYHCPTCCTTDEEP